MKVRVKNELGAGQRLAAPKVRKVWSGDQDEHGYGEGICIRIGGCDCKFSYRHLSQESETGFVITTVQNTLLASDESAFQVAWRRWGVPQIRGKYHS